MNRYIKIKNILDVKTKGDNNFFSDLGSVLVRTPIKHHAGVTQLVECQLPKLNVAG